MLPIFTRLNAVLTSAMTVLAAMTVGLSLSTGYFEFVSGLDEAVVSVHEPQILKAWRDPATREDVVMVGIKFKADMRPLWHWNVKQVFLYCTASWTTKGRLHETFLYDVIIREPQEHVVGSDDRPVLDYVLKGDQGTLVGNNFTLHVKWNVMPLSGLLYYGETSHSSIPFTIPEDTPLPIRRSRQGRH
eukprot:Rhum_TRINITY_DN10063_c0_g1::Rhum_TRINITY_DN10063_c0_g1_i1::g.36609::m.36609/K12948/SPCS3, SPC3; signal peptidase complex subunit 3